MFFGLRLIDACIKPSRAAALIAAIVGLHIALIAPFVPAASGVPAGLGTLTLTALAVSLVPAARFKPVDILLGGPDKDPAAHWLAGPVRPPAPRTWDRTALVGSFGSG